MIKIQVRESTDRLILNVEGRLAGAFVPELERCWKMARAEAPGRKIAVDLKDVTCVDRSGRCLLQSMQAGGVDFIRAGMALQDILQQIKEQLECRP